MPWVGESTEGVGAKLLLRLTTLPGAEGGGGGGGGGGRVPGAGWASGGGGRGMEDGCCCCCCIGGGGPFNCQLEVRGTVRPAMKPG